MGPLCYHYTIPPYGRSEGTRTPSPLVPNQVPYQLGHTSILIIYESLYRYHTYRTGSIYHFRTWLIALLTILILTSFSVYAFLRFLKPCRIERLLLCVLPLHHRKNQRYTISIRVQRNSYGLYMYQHKQAFYSLRDHIKWIFLSIFNNILAT